MCIIIYVATRKPCHTYPINIFNIYIYPPCRPVLVHDDRPEVVEAHLLPILQLRDASAPCPILRRGQGHHVLLLLLMPLPRPLLLRSAADHKR